MTENKFIYCITDQDGRSFYESSGLVQSQGQFRELQHAPDGFQDKTIEFKRDSKWFGVFRNFSFPLSFVRDGRSILNHIRYKLGYEFRSFLVIYILDFFINNTHYGFGYVPYYRGEFDLTTVKKSENKIEVSLLDGGIEAMIKANENTEYEIPIEGSEIAAVEMEGINLKNTIQYIITDGFIADNYPYNKSHIVDLQEVYKEVNDIGGVKTTSRTKVNNNNQNIKATGQWFMQATTSSTVTVEYDYMLTRSNAGGLTSEIGMTCNSQIRLINKNGIGTGYTLFQTNQPWELQGTNRVNGTITINVNEGDQLYFYTMVNPQGDGANTDTNINFNYSGTGLFKVTYFYKHPPAAVPGYHASILFKKLVEKMTDNKYSADLTYLNKKKEYFITCGDAIRRLPDAKIKTSFNDFFQWLWCNEDVYFGIGKFQDGTNVVKRAVIGDLKDQFQLPPAGSIIFGNSPIVNSLSLNKSTNLGAVRNIELDTDNEKLFNTIKIGCKDQNYEDVNGRTEFNSEQTWHAPVVRSSRTLDLSSPYREDAIGMEYVRINFGGKTTTDASSDNETFAIVIDKNNPIPAFSIYMYKVDRSETITGVIDPASHFNAKFSPKHKLLRKGRYLRSCLFDVESRNLNMTSSKKNADVKFNSLVEKEDIPVSSLGEPYFRPDLMKFETYKPINLIELQNENDLKRNCFKIVWNDKDYYGFLHTVSIQPWMNEVQSLTLISSPKNDLSSI
ncbi:MAG: hypothetical protein KF862_07195 [Chitinophagaceae bacterium]|nr:hypothetical protein [Chitinophagaceae bacterium]